ncbi:hypothetical protein NDU88_007500 [Pleurodeles waltl]|uniref:Uncharacterized protein n=1 Tax=Pleurodeles waltl TaxID=8319 RepID=A0AAV7SSH4_PLEWA|nr:hypothetical protein NDU88_007500 [Pleurodeles waltl]
MLKRLKEDVPLAAIDSEVRRSVLDVRTKQKFWYDENKNIKDVFLMEVLFSGDEGPGTDIFLWPYEDYQLFPPTVLAFFISVLHGVNRFRCRRIVNWWFRTGACKGEDVLGCVLRASARLDKGMENVGMRMLGRGWQLQRGREVDGRKEKLLRFILK